jgi:GntR family galactonate operon transcriptional repressor
MTYLGGRTRHIRRRGIHAEVLGELGVRIVGGVYPPGTILPRADVWAEEMRVSRTVIREVTRVLAEKGLVEARQRSGTRVCARADWDLMDPEVISWYRIAGPDLQFFRDLTDVRVAIEATAARLAAERATPEEIERLRELYQVMEERVGDPDDYASADLELHAAILHAAHNALLARLTQAISEGLVASRDVTVRSPGGSERALPLHANVIDAIAARDADLAAESMTELVNQAIRDIEVIIGRHQVGRARTDPSGRALAAPPALEGST